MKIAHIVDLNDGTTVLEFAVRDNGDVVGWDGPLAVLLGALVAALGGELVESEVNMIARAMPGWALVEERTRIGRLVPQPWTTTGSKRLFACQSNGGGSSDRWRADARRRFR